MLLGLVEEGYVRRRPDPVSYALGPALIDLGDRARQFADVRAAASPLLAELSGATVPPEMAWVSEAIPNLGAIRGPISVRVPIPVLVLAWANSMTLLLYSCTPLTAAE